MKSTTRQLGFAFLAGFFLLQRFGDNLGQGMTRLACFRRETPSFRYSDIPEFKPPTKYEFERPKDLLDIEAKRYDSDLYESRGGYRRLSERFEDERSLRDRLLLDPSSFRYYPKVLSRVEFIQRALGHRPLMGGGWRLQPVQRPHLLVLLPQSNEEFVRIYGEHPTAAQERELARLNSYAKSLKGATILSDASERSVLEVLERERSVCPLVILGHSEQHGDILVLGGGHRLKVSTLREECIARNMTCFILTCRGKDFGIGQDITAEYALALWTEAYRDGSGDTVDEFVIRMEYYIYAHRIGKRITLTLTAGGLTEGFYCVYRLSEEGMLHCSVRKSEEMADSK